MCVLVWAIKVKDEDRGDVYKYVAKKGEPFQEQASTQNQNEPI